MVIKFWAWFSWEKLELAILQTYYPQTIQRKLIFPLGTISHSGNHSVDRGRLLACKSAYRDSYCPNAIETH